MSKVPVQKGKVDPNPMTQGQQTVSQAHAEGRAQNAMLRRGQTLDLHMPKGSK